MLEGCSIPLYLWKILSAGGGGHLNKAQLQSIRRELSFGLESTDATEFVQSKGGFSVIAETTCSELVSIRLSSH